MPKKAEAKETGLIVVKQLPVIEDQLLAVKSSIEERVRTALSLVCTEETYKQIKQVRSDLNKEYSELEKRRKEVKASILAPYEKFEGVYRECAGDLYARADRELKAKIDEVEAGLKKQKADDLEKYFAEYRQSLNIPEDFVLLPAAKIRVGLSDSRTSLRKQAAEFLDRISRDLQVIDSYNDREELMVEYAKTYDLSDALLVVDARHKEIERQRQLREEMRITQEEQSERVAAVKEAMQPLDAPVSADVPVEVPQEVKAAESIFVGKCAEATYTVRFAVSGTLEQLKRLKQFLNEGGYIYESC